MSLSLNGTYIYRSFRHEPVQVFNNVVQGNPDVCIPWIFANAEVALSTDTSNQVTGTLTVPGTPLKGDVKGSVDSTKDPGLEAVLELTINAPWPYNNKVTNVNKLKAFLVKGSTAWVGGILVTKNDLAVLPGGEFVPNGTLGSFTLFPAPVTATAPAPAATPAPAPTSGS